MTSLSMRASWTVATTASLLIAGTGLSAQDAKKTQEPQATPSWAVQCVNAGGKLACKAYQTIALRKTGQRLLMVSVNRPTVGEGPAMLVHLPHRLFLPAGVTLKVDKGAVKTLVVQTCDAKGCYAGVALDKALITAMQSGKSLTVGFQNLEKKPLSIAMPLAGFATAFGKLK